MNPEYVTWLFGVSLAVSAIAIGCDLKWRRYPKWAYYASLALVGLFWYLFGTGSTSSLTPIRQRKVASKGC